VSDDRLGAALRRLCETEGYKPGVVDRIVEGANDPSVRDPLVLGRKLFTEAQAARFARDVSGPTTADRGSVLTALTEVFQRSPFGLTAAEADRWARTRIRDVAEECRGRVDLAEQMLWQIVGALRLGSACMPSSAAPSASPGARPVGRRAQTEVTEAAEIVEVWNADATRRRLG